MALDRLASASPDDAAALEAEGRMRPAGHVAVEAAKADVTWTFLDDIEALIEPEDLREALDG